MTAHSSRHKQGVASDQCRSDRFATLPLCHAVTILLMTAVGCWQVGASSHSAAPVTYSVSAGCTYDDNVFHYSPQDIDTFIHNYEGHRGKFASVRSLDDAVVNVSGRLLWRPKVIRRHTTQLGLAVSAHQYVSNPVKSHLSAALRFRQYLSKALHAEGSYLVVPRYLIRNYPVPGQGTDYEPCTFAEHLLGIEVGCRMWELAPIGQAATVTPFLRYETDNYQPSFAVYDTRAWRTGAGAEVTLTRWLDAEGSYEFKAAAARGPNPDISYGQHDIAVGLKPSLGKLSLDLGYDYGRRVFTAQPEADSTHAGRIDVTTTIRGHATLSLSPRLTLVLEYDREARNSSSPYRADIDEVKNYTENRIGLGVRLGEG